MKRNNDLLNDMLDDVTGSSADALEFTLRAVRARHRRMLIARVGLTTLLLSVSAYFLSLGGKGSRPRVVIQPATVEKIATVRSPAQSTVPRPAEIIQLTDDELLARFPGMAVALVGQGDRMQLIFPSTRHDATTTRMAD